MLNVSFGGIRHDTAADAACILEGEVVKMQQKYGAQIPEDQVEAVVNYLTKNYGVTTNGTQSATVATTQTHATDAQQIATRYGCLGCHNPAVKLVGPAYRDIAVKYKSDPAAFAKVDEQIHKGGSGKWGPIMTPPFPQVTPGETKILADWILGLSRSRAPLSPLIFRIPKIREAAGLMESGRRVGDQLSCSTGKPLVRLNR